MVTSQGRIKLIDFGLSKKLEAHVKVAKSAKGTPTYMSHEKYLENPYDGRDDIWSTGVILSELILNKRVQRVVGSVFLSDPKNSNVLEELLTQCDRADVGLSSIARLMLLEYHQRPQAYNLLIKIEETQTSTSVGNSPLPPSPTESMKKPLKDNQRLQLVSWFRENVSGVTEAQVDANANYFMDKGLFSIESVLEELSLDKDDEPCISLSDLPKHVGQPTTRALKKAVNVS
jgi:serine/threonine protein kinase